MRRFDTEGQVRYQDRYDYEIRLDKGPDSGVRITTGDIDSVYENEYTESFIEPEDIPAFIADIQAIAEGRKPTADTQTKGEGI
jgi:hypothetical protein